MNYGLNVFRMEDKLDCFNYLIGICVLLLLGIMGTVISNDLIPLMIISPIVILFVVSMFDCFKDKQLNQKDPEVKR